MSGVVVQSLPMLFFSIPLSSEHLQVNSACSFYYEQQIAFPLVILYLALLSSIGTGWDPFFSEAT